MAIRIVQSKQNARVKELRAARLRPPRTEVRVVALEGLNLVVEALRSGLHMETLFVAQGSENLLAELGLPAGVEVLALPREILDSAVTTESPQPIAALARPRSWQWEDVLNSQRTQPLLVILSGIQDPGNLGTILRSAEAFGATGTICLPGTVSPWNPKAMRSSAGSVFRIPVIAASEDDCFRHLRDAQIRTFAAMAHDASPLSESDLADPAALVIGSEGNGLSPKTAARCDARVTIPCPGPVESLNAAIATSILLYEAARQRATR